MIERRGEREGKSFERMGGRYSKRRRVIGEIERGERGREQEIGVKVKERKKSK